MPTFTNASQIIAHHSHQLSFLMTHLYEFFGGLLGCSMQGMAGFDAYGGRTSMYEVHKFMDLDSAQVTYFVTQVGLAAASFGVAKVDITAAADAINTLFNVKCAAATPVLKDSKAELQSICIADDCMQARNATCDKYENASMPSKVSSMAGTMMPTGTMSGSMTMTGSMAASGTPKPSGSTTAVPTGAASANGLGFAGVVAGVLAFVL
ncbi:Globin [Tolypocladium paradoxum]|uniref:Globin n=1 Tax=Tolypocladium paradoxum TaxID=94208 RepID=A0A2S4KRG5_9HYPO|nr:Globin [Tolypocladium paradoxum]